MELPKRRSTRLKGYDYSCDGAYFVTICTQDRKEIFGKIMSVGVGVLDDPCAPRVSLSKYGQIVKEQIDSMSAIYDHISVEKYVIMPNHIHMIVLVSGGPSGTPAPTNAIIPWFVSTLKRLSNKQAGFSMFQRSFHDHIIRSEQDYLEIWQYIDQNPLHWGADPFHSAI